MNKQYQSKNFKEYEIDFKYNLIEVQNYTFGELIEKNSLFGNIMIIEKCKTKEEIENQMNKIIETIEDKSNDYNILINNINDFDFLILIKNLLSDKDYYTKLERLSTGTGSKRISPEDFLKIKTNWIISIEYILINCF